MSTPEWIVHRPKDAELSNETQSAIEEGIVESPCPKCGKRVLIVSGVEPPLFLDADAGRQIVEMRGLAFEAAKVHVCPVPEPA